MKSPDPVNRGSQIGRIAVAWDSQSSRLTVEALYGIAHREQALVPARPGIKHAVSPVKYRQYATFHRSSNPYHMYRELTTYTFFKV